MRCVINTSRLLILLISVYYSSPHKNSLSLCSWKCLVFPFTHIKYLIYMPFLANLVCHRPTGVLKTIKLSRVSEAGGGFQQPRNGFIYFSWICFPFSWNDLYVSNLASLLGLLVGGKLIWKVKIDQEIQKVNFSVPHWVKPAQVRACFAPMQPCFSKIW